jgi:DNA-binding transcriptional MerR regulator
VSVVDRSFLSIGEVLSLLKDEFEDITISKIRFLESQGLLDPERTPSGYRKFYDADVDRLRWILRQQKENFLPLKVIKDRLLPGDDGSPMVAQGDEPAAAPVPDSQPAPGRPGRLAPPGAEEVAAVAAGTRPVTDPRVASGAGVTTGVTTGSTGSTEAPAAFVPPAEPAMPGDGGRPVGQTSPVTARTGDGRRRVVATRRAGVVPPGGTSVSLEELVEASGLDAAGVADLEQYGLIAGRPVAGVLYYDEDAVVIARVAAGFRGFGVEARHLRIYKTAAEREAGFIEQLVTPLLKQRNPQARGQAMESVVELTELGEALRACMLRAALRDLTGP